MSVTAEVSEEKACFNKPSVFISAQCSGMVWTLASERIGFIFEKWMIWPSLCTHGSLAIGVRP